MAVIIIFKELLHLFFYQCMWEWNEIELLDFSILYSIINYTNSNSPEESMKKLLLIIGIISIIISVLSLLFASFNFYGYYHVLDGTADLYIRLHRRMITFFVIGIALMVIGIVCLIIFSKM